MGWAYVLSKVLAGLLIKYYKVLQYGQSQYVLQFGMNVSNTLIDLEARIMKVPTLKYNPASKQPNVVCSADQH